MTTTAKTSKYFQSPVKEEETDSEDDFDMVTSPPPRVTVNAKKMEKEDEEEEEEEEDSEEDDDDDWEEVEGKCGISRKHYNTFLSVFNCKVRTWENIVCMRGIACVEERGKQK